MAAALLRVTVSASGPLTDGHLPSHFDPRIPHAMPAVRICRIVVPSPCSSSSAAKRPAKARINASIGPVTSIPVPADHSASMAFARMSLNNRGPGKEPVGPEIFGDGNHSFIGNAAQTFQRSANVHLVDDNVSEHGRGRQAREVGGERMMLRNSSRRSVTGVAPRRRALVEIYRLMRNPDRMNPRPLREQSCWSR